MEYLIIGAGGTGGIIGAYMSKQNMDVTLIARGEHLSTLQKQGLKLETSWGETECIPVTALCEEQYQKQPDVIFICVKQYSLKEILPLLKRTAGPSTVVIPVVNVIGTGEWLQKELPESVVTDGCIYVAANLTGAGSLYMHGKILKIVYGLRKKQQSVTDTAVLQKLKQVKADLECCQIQALLSEEIEKDTWMKFAYVSPKAASGLYYGVTAGPAQTDGPERRLFIQLMKEVAAVTRAMGIHLDEDMIQKNLNILDALAPSAGTSMQLDIEAGKPSEFDGLVHEMVRKGKKLKVDVEGYSMIADWYLKRIPHQNIIKHRNYLIPEHAYYCRAAHHVLQGEVCYCHSCPLAEELKQTDNGWKVICSYQGYPAEGSPCELERNVERQIQAGQVPQFPYFSSGSWQNWKNTGLTMELYQQTLQFAAFAHRGKMRKGSDIPYIVHPMETAAIVGTMTTEPEIIQAAILHDIIEDTVYSAEDLNLRFGEKVTRLVLEESEDKREHRSPEDTWKIRKQEFLNQLADMDDGGQMIALADKLSNLRSTVDNYQTEGEVFWNRFNCKDKKAHEWYHRGIVEILEKYSNTEAWQELKQACDKVYG